MTPLFSRRQTAALLAYLGIIALLPGLYLPVMEVSRFGGLSAYSILDGIVALWRGGNAAVALVIALFSVVFPLAKLAAILAACLGPETCHLRRRFAKLALTLGKYSMLDVFVVALLILVFKLGDVVEARIAQALYLFLLAIALTTLANVLVVRGGGNDVAENEQPSSPEAPEAARGGLTRLLLLALAPVLVALVGLAIYLTASPGAVTSIFIQRIPGVEISILGLPDAPDYVLELRLATGDKPRTKTAVDQPIGNGLAFDVPRTEIALIDEIAVFDDNSVSVSGVKLRALPDKIVDRVIIGGERVTEGQKMRFELRGPVDPARTIGLAVSGVGGLWLVVGLGVLLLGMARGRA